MATFTVGAVPVIFGALVEGHDDKAGAVRTLTCGTHFSTEADWNVFRSFVNFDMEIVPIPWGVPPTVEFVVKGGPGPGTLVINGLTPTTYTAYLTEATRNQIMRGGHCKGKATFVFTTA